MNVLVVSPYPPRRCGIGSYARDQVARLILEGHRVTVLSPPDGAGDIRAPFLGGRALFRAARLGGPFDRVLVHFQPSLYYPPRRPVSKVLASLGLWWLVRRLPQAEVVVHEADPPLLWRPDYLVLRQAFRRAGRLAFHTGAERAGLAREYRLPTRGVIIEHRVDVAITPTRDQARATLGLDGAGPVFVCAGFLQPSKGFDRAVRAFGQASRRVSPGGASPVAEGPRLYIVGSVREPSEENLRYRDDLHAGLRAVAGASLVDRYVADEEFDRWLAAADWVLLPYRRSWSSGVLARAHALGVRSMVARVGGLAEQAGPGDIVFGDDQELTSAMGEAITGRAPSAQEPERRPPPPRKGRGMLFAMILVSVLLAALAQLTLKHGMAQVTHRGAVPLDLQQPVSTVRRVAANAAVWAGLATFVLSASVWLVVLSRVSLSFAYPFVSLTYVLILLFDGLILHEPVSGLRWAGVALIVAGILLISRTHQSA